MDDDALRNFYTSDAMWPKLSGAFSAPASDPMRGRGNDQTPCKAGVQTFGINPQGIVTACHTIPIPAGDLRKQSFREIWRTSPELARVRTLTWSRIEECNTCDVRPYCQRCHAMAHLEDGKLEGPSREACRHAVLLRDLLRDRGLVPATETALPPPLQRAKNGTPIQIRPPALRVIA